jgi:RHS repeat-associated protein
MGYNDGTAGASSPLAAGSSLSTYISNGYAWVYLAGDQHVHAIYWNGTTWGTNDATVWSGAPPAAAGSALTTLLDSGGTYRWAFQGSNQHLYEITYNNATAGGYQDMTAAAGAPLAVAGSSLSSYTTSTGQGWVYLAGDQHVHAIYWNGTTWGTNDATVWSGAPPAAASSALTTLFDSGGTYRWAFQGSNQHLYEITYNNATGGGYQDLTAAAGAPVAATGTALASYQVGQQLQWYFLDTNNHVDHIICTIGSTSCMWQDLTTATGAPAAVTGSALTAFADSSTLSYWAFVGSNQHVYEGYWTGSFGYNDLNATAPKEVADSGTVSLNIGAFTATACFGASTNPACTGQPVNSSIYQVASALAQAINVSTSPASATVSGERLTLTWKTPGPFTTSVSPLSTTHDNPSLFPNPSFTSTATNFSGGSGANLPVLNLNYDFHLGAGDNANVFGIANNKDTTRNQTFTYDVLNRLTSAQNAGTDCSRKVLGGNLEYWGNTYTYDAWANLTNKTKVPTACAGENLNAPPTANNQLVGYGYDAAGNVTSDPTDLITTAIYDAENRIQTVTKNSVSTTYTYDADGNRVEKSNGRTGTLYWYMSPGIVAESDLAGNLQSEYVFFNGERVARKDFPGNAVSYYFSDHLKTTAIVTDAQGNIKNESDYYPWGGELQFLNNDSNHYKFTGKERDNETNLDYFGARYYSNGLGRFVTPDWAAKPAAVPYAMLGDPQSLNLYSYVRNIPTTNVDVDGHQDDSPGFFDTAKKWLRELFSSASSRKNSGPDNPNSPSILPGLTNTTTHDILVDVTDKVGQATGVMNEVVAAADPTGQAAALNSMVKGDKVGVALAVAGPLLGAAGKTEKAVQEGVSVYQIVKDGEVTYVGITNNLARRSAEHGAALEEVAGGLTRKEARSVEQALIEHHGLAKNGGTLENKINSISPQRSGFREAVEFGVQVLHNLGYF